jgi:signal transduction histidine kinase
VLDIAKVEAGALPLHVTDVDLASVIPDVLHLLSPLASEREITLRQDRAAEIVRADELRLRQVLINLITNAIRYDVPGGCVEVGTEHDEHAVTIRVRDTGPGIPASMLDRLFIPFDRLGAESGPEQGAGLGLALARGLVEAMDGRLTIESQPGTGTTSAAVLPTAPGRGFM